MSTTTYKQNNAQDQSSDSTATLPGEEMPENAGDRAVEDEALKEKSQSSGDPQGKDEDDVLWVDWDGPNDPENPKK